MTIVGICESDSTSYLCNLPVIKQILHHQQILLQGRVGLVVTVTYPIHSQDLGKHRWFLRKQPKGHKSLGDGVGTGAVQPS